MQAGNLHSSDVNEIYRSKDKSFLKDSPITEMCYFQFSFTKTLG